MSSLLKNGSDPFYLDNYLKLKINRNRPSFHVDYHTELSKTEPLLLSKQKVRVVNLYADLTLFFVSSSPSNVVTV